MASRLGNSGLGNQFSVTKFGKPSFPYPVPTGDKERLRLANQKHIQQDTSREKVYTFCKKCGNTRMTVNFNNLPSARIGLWTKCRNGMDYRHHVWVQILREDYIKMKEMELKERLNYYIFDRDE